MNLDPDNERTVRIETEATTLSPTYNKEGKGSAKSRKERRFMTTAQETTVQDLTHLCPFRCPPPTLRCHTAVSLPFMYIVILKLTFSDHPIIPDKELRKSNTEL